MVLINVLGVSLSVPLSFSSLNGSGSILGAETRRSSPRFSIGRTIIVVSRYVLHLELRQCPALPARLRSRVRTQNILPVCWSPHQGAEPFEPFGLTGLTISGIRTTGSQKNT